MNAAKYALARLLRWSEKYTKTDMLYLFKGNFWMLFGRVIAVGSGICLTIILANLLSPTAFGTYKYIISIAGFVTAFSLSGLSTALTRDVAQNGPHGTRPLFWVSMKWSVPATVGTLCIAAYYYFQGNDILAIGLVLIALTSPFSNSFGLYKGLLHGLKDFRTLSLLTFPNSLIPILALITTLLFTQNLIAILIVYFLSNSLAGLIVYSIALKKHKVGYDTSLLPETVRYGKHLSVASFVSQIASQTDQLLLWHFAGPVQLAVYTFASAPLRELRNVTENIFPLAFPKFANKPLAEVKANLPLRLFQMFVISAGITLAYFIAAPYLFMYIFPKYTASIIWSQILALTLLLQPKGLIETMLTAQGDVRKRYLAVTTTQGIKIILLLILVPLYAIPGAVLAIVCTEIISALALWWAFRSKS